MDIDEKILNFGLMLSMEFGENWLTDISTRLKEKFPELSDAESKDCNTFLQSINTYAHDFVRKNPVKKGNQISLMCATQFKDKLSTKYNWISQNNLSKLYSQSCYYALK